MTDPVAAACLRAWQLDGWLAAALLLTGALYLRGWRRLRAQMPARFGAGRLAAFAAGLAALWLAVGSPLDAFAGFLLQAHMLQHLLLTMVAPPLLWLGAPAIPLLRGLPARPAHAALAPFLGAPELRRAARALVHPAVAWLAFAAAITLWHVPALYELALRSPAWHRLEHACFFAAALLFWFPIVQPWPSVAQWPRWTMIPYLLLADVLNTLLSAIFVFSERLLYPTYAGVPRAWAIAPLEDQAAAGALMWVPGSVVFLLPVGVILSQLLGRRGVRPAEMEAGARRARAGAAAPSSAPPTRSAPAAARFDLLTVPLLGAFLRWRYGRRVLQGAMLLLAIAVVADGLGGPQMAPMNLAGVLPWTWWRGLVVIALLAAGNLFCMACPFMLPRALGRRLLPAGRAWPRWLRGKWLALALLVLYLWAYEAFAPWSSPWWTAVIVLAYFGAAFAVDGLFRGASFCKHVCPIGQFHFVHSMASPLEVRVRDPARCGSCATHDCLRGNATQRGCELELFQPEKHGNLDCTFCLDCVQACPHDNVGILAVAPGRDLGRDPHRSSLRRLSQRPDVAALALVCVFGAFANAAGMLEPVLAWQARWQARLGFDSPLPLVTVGLLLALLAAPLLAATLAALASRALGRARTPARALGCRFALALVPLGLGMWSAHFVFHLLTGGAALAPVVQRVVADLGSPLLGAPAWGMEGRMPAADWLTGLELLLLDGGLLLTLYAAWRIARAEGRAAARPLGLLAPWALLALVLWGAGVWILFQPMQMRGMVH